MKQYWKWISLMLISLLLYAFFGFAVDRNQFPLYAYVALFITYFAFIKFQKQIPEKALWSFSVGVRVMLLFSIPLLTDDYYRFIWDGFLSNSGYSPFAMLPTEVPLEAIPGLSNELLSNLNSPGYISVYPPVLQWLFQSATYLFPRSILAQVIVMKLPVILADIGIIVMLRRLLKHWRMDVSKTWIYALNPLVIIEFSGNLHLEVYMMFFLLATLWNWERQKFGIAGLMMAFAIATKLLPLMLLPFFISVKGTWRNKLIFFLVLGVGLISLFYPLLLHPEEIPLFFSSIKLYFKTFEFNGGLYYVFRAIGYWITGYNTIATIGSLSSIAVFITAILLSMKAWKKAMKHTVRYMLILWLSYVLLASIVHPWYVLPLLMLGIFAAERFAVAWTLLIGFSYLGYHASGYEHSYIWVFIEYGAVFILLWLDRKRLFKSNKIVI